MSQSMPLSAPPVQADIVSLKIVSRRYRFLYVGIPKVATRSFKQLFLSHPAEDYQAEEAKLPLPLLLAQDPRLRGYFRWGFVRNPWARTVSSWLNKVANPGQAEIEGVLNKCPGLYPGMEFDEFVRWLLESPYGRDEGANRHWQSQYRFLSDARGEILLNWLGRLEAIVPAFEEVRGLIGLPDLELPVRNRSAVSRDGSDANTSVYYRDYYTPETRELVRRRYQQDIELFGYEF